MRKLALFVLGFTAAIFLSQYFLEDRGVLIMAACAAVVAIGLLFLKKRPAVMIRIVAFGMAAGSLWNYGYEQLFYDHAEALDGYIGGVSAVVSNYPVETDYGSKLEISIRFDSKPNIKAMLYLYGAGAGELEPGDIISFDGELLLASGKTENDYFASKGIPLFAYADSDIEVSGKVEHSGIRYFHRRVAKGINEKIADIFPDEAVPFMTAIVTGERTLLNKETYLFSILATTGTAHVVAVSGMHVAFLAGLLHLLLGHTKLGNLLCIPIILFFMAMTGFEASVVRAGIMHIIMLVAAVILREYDDITSISVALLILLAINPVSIKNGGLQLSFASTFGMILFGNKLYARMTAPFAKDKPLNRFYKNRISRKLITFFCATTASTFSALALTIPLTAVMFGYVSVIAPLSNILILWAVTLSFFMGIACVVLGFIFAPAAAVLAWVPTGLYYYIEAISSVIARIPFAAVYTTSIYVRAWLVFMYAELALFSVVKVRGKFITFIVSNAAALICCAGFTYAEAGSGSLSVSILDVGQGQCVLLSSEGRTAIVDCGGNLGDNAGDIAAEQLAANGETELDALILTHFHDDHANGAIELMRRVYTRALIVPQPKEDDVYGYEIIKYAEQHEAEIIYVTYGDYEYTLGAAEILVMPPLGAFNDNETGLSVICTSGRFDTLITGDMNSDTELRLVEYADIPDVEVLVAGHHGSKRSNSDALLEAARPDIAVISVGRNSYGHPADETIRRIRSWGADIYRTDENGAIVIRLGKQENTDG